MDAAREAGAAINRYRLAPVLARERERSDDIESEIEIRGTSSGNRWSKRRPRTRPWSTAVREAILERRRGRAAMGALPCPQSAPHAREVLSRGCSDWESLTPRRPLGDDGCL